MSNQSTQFKKGQVPWNKKGSLIMCKVCGIDTWCEPKQVGRKKFCSKTCLYKSGIQTKTFQKGHKIIGGAHSISHSKETKNKISESGKGKHNKEKAWNWIADREKVKLSKERGGPLHKQWSRDIKNRDNWKCRIADVNCDGKVVAHHILPWAKFPKLRYEVNNGITLCHFHHPRKRNDEMNLSPYFQKLVSGEMNYFG